MFKSPVEYTDTYYFQLSSHCKIYLMQYFILPPGACFYDHDLKTLLVHFVMAVHSLGREFILPYVHQITSVSEFHICDALLWGLFALLCVYGTTKYS